MPRVGFEPTIPVFVRAKTVHASDCAAAVIGTYLTQICILNQHEKSHEIRVISLLQDGLSPNMLSLYCSFMTSSFTKDNGLYIPSYLRVPVANFADHSGRSSKT
jgi:hypothetical protein